MLVSCLFELVGAAPGRRALVAALLLYCFLTPTSRSLKRTSQLHISILGSQLVKQCSHCYSYRNILILITIWILLAINPISCDYIVLTKVDQSYDQNL